MAPTAASESTNSGWRVQPATLRDSKVESGVPGGMRLEFEGAWSDTNDVVDDIGPFSWSLLRDGQALRVPYYANHRLDDALPGVRRAVVVIHGTLRNANDYYASVANAAREAEVEETTLIVAPQLLREEDLSVHHLPSDLLYWAYMGWRQGDQSLSTDRHPRPWQISSYAVVDSLIQRITAICPDLDTLVVAGHSAGGQFNNRYGAGSTLLEHVESELGVAVKVIVSNPSSYMYLNDRRWVPGTSYTFEVPEEPVIEECPGYDSYKYGLDDPNEYMAIGSDLLRQQYAERAVVYLLGGADNDPNSTYLETNCEAMLQGEHRLQRGTVYTHHLVDEYGPGIEERHVLAVVPGIGHDQFWMFNSSCGIFHLFDRGQCSPDLPDGGWTDVTPQTLRSVRGHCGSWGDYDGDGWVDLYIGSTNDEDVLARNLGPAGFEDATPSALRDGESAMMAAWGDYDNDSDLDLYATNWDDGAHLYRNDGGAFTDVTSGALAVDGHPCDVTWVDYDGDQDLDLYVTRTEDESDVLLRNDLGTFTDATDGVLQDSDDTRDAAWGDFDNDGDPDVYLVNYDRENRLLRNDGGTFSNITPQILAVRANSSSACWGDYDNDGDLDLFLLLRAINSRLYRNDGDQGFVDVSNHAIRASRGRTASWADVDNDGDLDLYMVDSAGGAGTLLRNDGGDSFTNATVSPLNEGGTCYGAAWADYDRDGDLDVFVARHDQTDRLFRNDLPADRHWLQVDLRGVESNRFGVGARLVLGSAGRTLVREVGAGSGYFGQNELTAAFGLGTAGTIDSLVIHWPSGLVQRLEGLVADHRVVIEEGEEMSHSPGPEPAPVSASSLACVPNPCRGHTTIRFAHPGPGLSRVAIFDLQGRRVREWPASTGTVAGPGPLTGTLSWDGRDGQGRPMPAGVYLVCLSGGTASGRTWASQRLLLFP